MSSVQILSNLNYPIGKVITEGLRNSLNTHIAVAFLKYSGVEVIQDALIDSLEKGAEFEIIVGLDFKTTDSKSIRFLLDLNKTYKKLRFYYYGDKENNKTDIVFHPKIYMFDNGKEKTSIIGSTNLTRGGLENNFEVNTIFTEKKPLYYTQLNAIYNSIKYADSLFTPNEEYLQNYDEVFSTIIKNEQKVSKDKSIQEKIKINNPNFTLYPADLQSDLINTSIADLFQYEKLTEMMLNTIAPNQSNEWLFNEFADFFGLSKNEATNNSVVLEVSGVNPNAYIPAGLTWSCSAGDFINNSPSLANDKGVAMVVALNNELTTILPQNQSFTCSEFSNATIINPNNSILQDAESFFDFKTRIQNNFKANTQSSYNLLATELANIGITNFSVHLNAPSQANNFVYSQTLIFLPSAIDNETAIKELIFGSMGVNCLLSGATSDNDNSRVRESNIDFFGSLIPIVYVIAKQVTLDIEISINLNVLLEVWSYFVQQLENAVTEFFANQKIGDAINIFMLNNIVYQTLNECSISMDRLEALSFNFSVGGIAVNINSANQELECVAFDTQLQLGALNVTKATN